MRLTCSCFNNKKITIKELFKIIDIRNSQANFLPESTLNIDIENHLKARSITKNLMAFQNFF